MLIVKLKGCIKKIILEVKRLRRKQLSMRTVHRTLAEAPQPPLTRKEKKTIASYWKEYGIVIKDYSWFQLFYGVTGKKDPRFIPNDIWDQVIIPHYNDMAVAYAWADKNHCNDFLPDVNFPAIIIQRIHGKFYFPRAGDPLRIPYPYLQRALEVRSAGIQDSRIF